MASRFTALPLGSGEAFLLETMHAGKKRAILVDSGKRSRHVLKSAVLAASPKLRHIDVAICTHQDSDHANGFRHFATEWYSTARTIGEYWLPGRWSAAVPVILTDPIGFTRKLWAGCQGIAEELRNSDRSDERLATLAFRLRELARQKEISGSFYGVAERGEPDKIGLQGEKEEQAARLTQAARSLGLEPEDLPKLVTEIEASEVKPSKVISRAGNRSFGRIDPYWWVTLEDGPIALAASLFVEAMETAKTIARIAESAAIHKIPIRWFDFGLFEQGYRAEGGIDGFLRPVSAVELRVPPRSVSAEVLFFCLRLSQQNVESLVFQRVESDAEPGVLFLGDSRLAFGVEKPTIPFNLPTDAPKRRMVLTAPHHGSRVNDAAYGIVETWLDGASWPPIYVRNGGIRSQTLEEFLNQPNRACALCRHCGSRELLRRITLTARRGNWVWPVQECPPNRNP